MRFRYDNHRCCCSSRVVVGCCFFTHVVLIGQVKQYVACESQHQYDAFDMPDEIQLFLDEIHQ